MLPLYLSLSRIGTGLFSRTGPARRFSTSVQFASRRYSSTVISTKVAVENSANANKYVGRWLIGCSGMVVGAVVLGGVTRLTESGLSMVTWRLFGERPPFNQSDWEAEFKKYQQYPEFKMKNSNITIEDFKRIWWMEYAHRTWGRFIGVAFYIPAAYFWSFGYFNKVMKRRTVVMGGLLAFQGLLGWYMVKSGLEDRFHKQSDVPRVSQYRLAAHLGSAIVLYSFMFWSTLDLLMPPEVIQKTKELVRFRKMALSCKGLIFLTAISGAFVAGLDAGLVYNSFPKMADKWIPDDILAYSPVVINFTENPTTVQFDHRILGVTTFSAVMALWLMSQRTKLPARAHLASNILALAAIAQVTLGITTLLLHVPTELAAAHQSNSLLLLSTALWLCHELKRIPK